MNKLLSSKWRTSRRTHTCGFCGGLIEKGEWYRCDTCLCDTEFFTFHTHERCGFIAEVIWDYVDPDEGMSDEDFKEGCHDICRDFICPDCPKWQDDECDEYYCLDKLYAFLKEYELYPDGRYLGGRYWKVRKRNEKERV